MCFYAFYSSFWGMKLQSAFKEIFIQVIQAKNLLKKDTWTPVTFFNKRTFHLLWHEGFYVAQYFFKLIAYSNYINTFKKNYQDIYINFRSNPSD